MNSLKKGTIACVIALSQLLLNLTAIASDENDSNTQEAQFSEAELAQILAPIALYPDSLLTHIVIASTYPLEVVEASRWREQNSELGASEAVERAESKGWDPSIAALVAFPNVLERLNADLKWTQNLGDAFLEDEGRVLDTIQTLRQQAEQANSLDNMQNMRVTKVNKQIVIEPMQKEIVYVPYYDTRVIYGNWYWHLHPPVYWERPHYSSHFPSGLSARFHWNVGINIRFNYFFSAFEWRNRHIVVTRHSNSNKYRSYKRIASSRHVKRWQHEPIHRRNVAYRQGQKSRDFARNNKGISNDGRNDRRYTNNTTFRNKLNNNSSTSLKTNGHRLANNHNETRGISRLMQGNRNLEQSKHSKQRNLKAKLTRNNRVAQQTHNTHKSVNLEKQAKQNSRQKQSNGQEKGRGKLDYRQANKGHTLKENHQQRNNGQQKVDREPTHKQHHVNNRKEVKNYSQKSQRQRVRSPKQSEQLSRNKRER